MVAQVEIPAIDPLPPVAEAVRARGVRLVRRLGIGGTVDSPIEEAYFAALAHENARRELGIVIVPQYQWGRYRLDFLLMLGAVRVAIECDGHDYHERTKEQAAHDRRRDREIQRSGLAILRFTGSEIYRDARACAHETVDFILSRLAPAAPAATSLEAAIARGLEANIREALRLVPPIHGRDSDERAQRWWDFLGELSDAETRDLAAAVYVGRERESDWSYVRDCVIGEQHRRHLGFVFDKPLEKYLPDALDILVAGRHPDELEARDAGLSLSMYRRREARVKRLDRGGDPTEQDYLDQREEEDEQERQLGPERRWP